MTSGLAAFLAALPLVAGIRSGDGSMGTSATGTEARAAYASVVCSNVRVATDYYRIELVPTRRVPAAANATGYADVVFDESPFGVAVSAKGYYRYDVEVNTDGLPQIDGREYIVWITPPTLDDVRRVGPLVDGRLETSVVENKYLVVITVEPEGTNGASWTGPIVMRGMSRSGLMHTMAGHGPFDGEPCAQFGY